MSQSATVFYFVILVLVATVLEDCNGIDEELMIPVHVENQDLTNTNKTACAPRPLSAVTEEMVLSIAKSEDGDFDLVDFSVTPGTQVGDNYASTIYSVKMYGKGKLAGKCSTKSIIFKIPLQTTMSYRKENAKKFRTFEKEAKMYDQVLPDFVKFQQERGLEKHELFQSYPTCYKTHINAESNNDKSTDYIALENLRPVGFTLANRTTGLDKRHCEMALQELARFHATSFAMFGGDYNQIQEQYPFLEETKFVKPQDVDKNLKMYHSQIFKVEAEELRKVGLNKEATFVERIYDDPMIFYKLMHTFTGEKVENAVLGHGDFWTNNIMFAYDKESGKPRNVKVIDFQLVRSSSRAVDLNFFMYRSTELWILNEEEEQLLQIYHNEFTSFCNKLGYINHKLTFKALLDEFESYRPYGIIMGLLGAPFDRNNNANILTTNRRLADTEENATKNVREFLRSMMKDGAVVESLKNIVTNHMPKCPKCPHEWNGMAPPELTQTKPSQM